MPFYDITRSYEDNYDQGPFGDFTTTPSSAMHTPSSSSFLGFTVGVPFGIPAGPLLNSRFVKAAWNWGYNLATYKTVRGTTYPCHPAPNIIAVSSPGQDIHPGDTVIGDTAKQTIDVTHDGITNSFGVPSKPVAEWEKDVASTLEAMNDGNLLILSYMGTKKEGMTFDEYVADFVHTARAAAATGAPVLEVNFSCPNVGKEGLICNDVETSAVLLEAMKPVVGNTPLLVKIGYFAPNAQSELEKLLDAIHLNAAGVVAINTIQATVVDKEGRQALPGSPVRMQSGICGAAIRWAGREMSERIIAYKRSKGWKDFTVVGVGGVVTPEDYFAYMQIGVDAVQAATGPMWQPDLAIRIRQKIQG